VTQISPLRNKQTQRMQECKREEKREASDPNLDSKQQK